MLSSATSITPAAAGAGAISADLTALLTAIAPAYKPRLLMNQLQFLALGLVPVAPELMALVINASTVSAGTVIAVDLDALAIGADGAPAFDVSANAAIHMATPASALVSGAAPPPTLAQIATPVRSLWQTDTLTLRCLWPVSWGMRRTGAVAYAAGVNW